MRAREFTINIPINVTIDGNEVSAVSPTVNKPKPTVHQTSKDTEPKGPVDVAPNFNKNPDREAEEEKELGVFTPPLQQKIELLKKNTGVDSEFDHEDVNDGPSI